MKTYKSILQVRETFLSEDRGQCFVARMTVTAIGGESGTSSLRLRGNHVKVSHS